MTGIRVNSDGRIGKGSGVRGKEGGLRERSKENLSRFSFPFSTLSSLRPQLLLSALLFFFTSLLLLLLPPPSVCVHKWELGRKYMGFSHSSTGADLTPRPLIFCLSLHFLCLTSEGSLEENHPYFTTKYSACLLEHLCCSLFHSPKLYAAMVTALEVYRTKNMPLNKRNPKTSSKRPWFPDGDQSETL